MKNDYYKTIETYHRENPEPINNLVLCPKCGGKLKEIHNLNIDGRLAKNDKIVDLQCLTCNSLLSNVK